MSKNRPTGSNRGTSPYKMKKYENIKINTQGLKEPPPLCDVIQHANSITIRSYQQVTTLKTILLSIEQRGEQGIVVNVLITALSPDLPTMNIDLLALRKALIMDGNLLLLQQRLTSTLSAQ